MKTKFYSICLLLAFNLSAWGALYNYGTYSEGGSAIGAIPDNNIIGLGDAHALTGLGTSISSVMLSFTLAGGYGTDLSGYLRLGNLVSSPYYDLTSLVQANPTISGSGLDFTVNASTLASTFNGFDPNNSWTLFFADQSGGGTTTLNGWSLDITAVPEPINVALAFFGVSIVGVGAVRRYWGSSKATFQSRRVVS